MESKKLCSLTVDNYFEDTDYVNFSKLKLYDECQAKAWHSLHGEYKEKKESIALLVGSYVDAAIEGTLEEFKQKNLEIYKYKNTEKGLKNDFLDADKIINKINKDKYAKHFLTGEKQKIYTGVINGIPVKCKIDNINLEKGFITDLKTTRDIYYSEWNQKNKKREHFIQKFKYIHQLAFYREIVKQNTGKTLTTWIVAFDKTDNLKGCVWHIEPSFLDEAYDEILEWIELYHNDHKDRCEKCDYCLSTTKNSRLFKSYSEFLSLDLI